MKSLTMNLTLAAAALMAASTAASAAEMKFEVPFAFRAGSKLMLPGKYVVQGSNNESNFLIKNVQTAEGVYLLSQEIKDPLNDWKSQAGGTLRFECTDGRCALTEVWTHHGYPAHALPTVKGPKGQATQLAVIHAVVENGK